MELKFKIGDIVKFYKDLENSYLVLATQNENLTSDYLQTHNELLKIEKIEQMAASNITITPGFQYKIININELNNGKFTDAFNYDID